jgi:hypothetical protein
MALKKIYRYFVLHLLKVLVIKSISMFFKNYNDINLPFSFTSSCLLLSLLLFGSLFSPLKQTKPLNLVIIMYYRRISYANLPWERTMDFFWYRESRVSNGCDLPVTLRFKVNEWLLQVNERVQGLLLCELITPHCLSKSISKLKKKNIRLKFSN